MTILTVTAIKIIVPIAVLTAFITRHLYRKWQNNRLWERLNIPVFTGGLRTNYQELIRAQYIRDPNQSYILQTPFHKVIVVPHTLVNEYTWLPEEKVTSAGDLCERFFGDYTCIGSMTPDTPGDRSHISIGFTKTQLTKNVNFIIDDTHAEIEFGLAQIWDSKCNENSWTALKVHPSTTTLCRHVFQSAFVGKELARNPEWQQLCMEHSPAAMAASVALSKWPWFARPIVAPFLPEMRELRRRFNKLVSFIEPLHKKRLEEMQSPHFKNPHDLIGHYIEHSGSANAKDTAKMMEAFVIINFAGIMSTGMVMMQALLDLAAHPEYIEPLRQEAQSLVSAEGSFNLRPSALAKLSKMDSFLKESQRFNHANLLSVYRKTTKQPLQLSNGLLIPREAHIAASNAYSVIGDDGKYRDFKGFQWAEKRTEKGNEHKFTYVQPGPGALEFGAGRNACPGRFFATNVIKATLVRLLLQYDFRLPEGQTDRPANRFNNLFAMIPDVEASLEFRKRPIAMTAP